MGHYEFKETGPTDHQALELIFSPDNMCKNRLCFGVCIIDLFYKLLVLQVDNEDWAVILLLYTILT